MLRGLSATAPPPVGLVLLYTVFIGLALYLILTLSDPFQGFGVEVTTFEKLVETLKAQIN